MRKTIFIVLVVHVVAATVCVFALLIFQLTPRSVVQAAPQKPEQRISFLKQPAEDAGNPVRLRIPSIEVDAAITSVGLTAEGAMDLPDDPDNVGWYNLGSRPGQQGSAVLAGHLNWYNGKTGVFQHLNRLEEGDIVSVETERGRFLLFTVREIQSYSPEEYVPDVFAMRDGSHLNLVTCGGVWDPVAKIYRERLVVFAEAVDRM